MKVLIVEDEMIISEDIAMMLEEWGYKITEQAVDYEEAIESFKKDRPDLALLDINLIGDKDGIHVAHKINELGRIPFIYTSSLGDALTIARAKETLPAAYLVKPFKDEQLFAAIEMAMASFSGQEESPEEEEKLPIFNDSIFIKAGHKFVKVAINDIHYIQKSDNYLEIHTITARHMVRGSMGGFLRQLGSDQIFQTHRSYAVNIKLIKDITPLSISIGEIEIPLAKSYSEVLLAKFKIF